MEYMDISQEGMKRIVEDRPFFAFCTCCQWIAGKIKGFVLEIWSTFVCCLQRNECEGNICIQSWLARFILQVIVIRNRFYSLTTKTDQPRIVVKLIYSCASYIFWLHLDNRTTDCLKFYQLLTADCCFCLYLNLLLLFYANKFSSFKSVELLSVYIGTCRMVCECEVYSGLNL